MQVDEVTIDKHPNYIVIQENPHAHVAVGDRFMQTVGDPDTSTTLTYEFQDVVIEESGTLEFQAVLLTRQGERNYRKVFVSDIRTVTISDDELFQPEIT